MPNATARVRDATWMSNPWEASTARHLRRVLDRLPDRSPIADSSHFVLFLNSLECFAPAVMAEVSDWWKHESFDGFYWSSSRKVSSREAEFFGICILITDQSFVPLHVRLRVAPVVDEIEWLECRVGERGDGPGGMGRFAWREWHLHLPRLLVDVARRADRIRWACHVTRLDGRVQLHEG